MNVHSAEWLAVMLLIERQREVLMRRLVSQHTSPDDTQFVRGQLAAFEQIESLAKPALPAIVGRTTFETP